MNVEVSINRGQGAHEKFIGKVIAETNLFYKVTWDYKENKNECGKWFQNKNEYGEWFPKKSQNINCKII